MAHDEVAPAEIDGSTMTRVANIPGVFSVSRWLTKKLPRSYTSSL
jgi:hypothetical protein